ncbi:hypothetical protein [Streptomyces sp. NPDC093261]|uniref:hypothetical protein n=1 Tax=Streptomyces sp. NPDC093261 TaxID=3366037 RepID=UPI0037F33783
MRRHLPTPWRHARAERHLRFEAENLVPMHLGRIRSDLQQRLTERARHLDSTLEARYEAVARRIRTVLDADRQQTLPADHCLTPREQLLRQILGDLSELAADAPAGNVP